MAYVFDQKSGQYLDEQTGQPYRPQVKLSGGNPIGEVGTGAVRGLFDTGAMLGDTLQAPGAKTDPGYALGRMVSDSMHSWNDRPSLQLHPDQHGMVVNTLASGAEMLAPSLMMGGLDAVTGGTAGTAIAGLSQYTNTYDRVKAAGASDDDANKAGVLSGLIEAGGEHIGAKATQKLFGGARMLQGTTIDSALQGLKNPAVLAPFAKEFAKGTAGEVLTEMGQNAGEAAVESAYGADSDPWQAAKDAIAPTFGLSVLLGGFGINARRRRASQIKNDVSSLADTSADPIDRMAAANRMGTLLDSEPPPGVSEGAWKQQVVDWRLNALEAINGNLPVSANDIMSGAIGAHVARAKFDISENYEQPTAASVTDDMGYAATPAGHAQRQASSQFDAPENYTEAVAPTVVDDYGNARTAQAHVDALQGERFDRGDNQSPWGTGVVTDDQGNVVGTAPSAPLPSALTENTVVPEAQDALAKFLKGAGITHGGTLRAIMNVVNNNRASITTVGDLVSFADKMLPEKNSEAQTKAWTAVSNILGERDHGETENRSQGTESEPAASSSNATSSSDRGQHAAEGRLTSEPAEGKTVASEPASGQSVVSEIAVPTKETSHGQRQEEVLTGEGARENAPSESALTLPTTQPSAEVHDEDQRSEPTRTSTPTIAGIEAQKAYVALTPEARKKASRQWDIDREAAKEAAGAGEDFYAPKWKDLSDSARETYATGISQDGRTVPDGRRFSVAASVHNDERAGAKADDMRVANSKRLDAARKADEAAGDTSTLVNLVDKIEKSSDMSDATRASLQQKAVALDAKLRKTDVSRPYSEVRDSLYDPESDRRAVVPADKVRNVTQTLSTAMEVLNESERTGFLLQSLAGGITNAEETEAATGKKSLGELAKLAKQLVSTYGGSDGPIKDIKLNYTGEVSTSASGAPRLGNYNAKTQTITIYKGGENWHTIMHETVHALTAHAMLEAQQQIKDGKSTSATAAYNRLDALYRYLKTTGALEGEYASKNVFEFASEVMSNQRLQEKLRSTPGLAVGEQTFTSKVTNALAQFMDAVRSLLRLPASVSNALTQAVTSVSELMDLQNRGVFKDVSGSKTFDALADPASAAENITKDTQGFVRSAAKAVSAAVGRTDLSPKAFKASLYLASTKQIERWVGTMGDSLKSMQQPIRDFFSADDSKTKVSKMLTDQHYAYMQDVYAALNATGQPERYGRQMALMSMEASRLGFDLSKTWAENKAANPKLSESEETKSHVDSLSAEYRKWKSNAKLRPLADLIQQGYLVNRRMYVAQTATLLRSSLESFIASKGDSGTAAQAILNKFGKDLDILNEATSGKNSNPSMFMDSKTSDLDAAIRSVMDMSRQHFAGSDMKESLDLIDKFYHKAIDNPYMHLGRDGQYMLKFNVADTSAQTLAKLNTALSEYGVAIAPFKDGKTHVFMRFGTQQAMLDAHQKLAALQGVVKDGTLAGGAISDAGAANSAFSAGETVTKLRNALTSRFESLQASGGKSSELSAAYQKSIEMVNSALIDLMDTDSARKMSAAREGHLGYSLDFAQSYASRAQAYISTISNMYASPAFAKSFRDMKASVGDVELSDPKTAVRGSAIMDELAARHSNALSPVKSPIVDTIKAFGYHFYLSMSPAFIITNMMQPYHLTLPFIGGRYGFTKTAVEMGKATALAMSIVKNTLSAAKQAKGWSGMLDAQLLLSNTKLSEDQKQFVNHLIGSGVVDFTQAHEIGDIAQGKDRRAATLAKALGIASHYSEVVNRLTAGLVAYKLAMADPRFGDGGSRRQKALDYAIEAVNRTQFNYSDHNTARALGRHGIMGKMTPLTTSFQQYSFQTMEHYIQFVKDGFLNKNISAEDRKAAQKGLAGTLAMTGALAGVLGLPFANVIAAVANSAGFGGDGGDDDVRNNVRQWLYSIFGDTAGDAIAHGVPRQLVGIDIGSRVGHADLLPGTGFLSDRRSLNDMVPDQALKFFGPAIGAGFNIAGGASKIAHGDLIGGINDMLPAAVKGMAKAVEVAREGGYQNSADNDIPVPVSKWGITAQALGFTPTAKATQAEASFYKQSHDNVAKIGKTQIRAQAIKAFEGSDSGDIDQARIAIMNYNLDHPDAPISMESIQSSVASRARARMVAELSGTGILDSRMQDLPKLREKYGWSNVTDE